VLLLTILLRLLLAAASETPATAKPQKPVDFAKDVQPILERRCMPCHFPGGVMHAKLPFDRPETITTLGTKLFTRIKKDDEQTVIRAFLAAAAAPLSPQPGRGGKPSATAQSAASAPAARPAPATPRPARAMRSNAARAPKE
jgi:hypothetical protein